MTQVLTPRQVDQFHGRAPGITEDLLLRLTDEAGATPYAWLAEAVRGLDPVLDVGCGSAPMADLLGPQQELRARGPRQEPRIRATTLWTRRATMPSTRRGPRYLGVDRSAAELARAARARPGVQLVRGDALRLPLRGPFAAVTASMALMLVAPLAAALGEVVRVLAPGGVLAATVPALGGGRPGDGDLHAAVLGRLRRSGVTYPERLAPHGLAARFAACGLRLLADSERRFALPLRDDGDLRLLVASYYAPEARDADRAAAVAVVRERVGAAGEAGYPLRRLVAVRA